MCAAFNQFRNMYSQKRWLTYLKISLEYYFCFCIPRQFIKRTRNKLVFPSHVTKTLIFIFQQTNKRAWVSTFLNVSYCFEFFSDVTSLLLRSFKYLLNSITYFANVRSVIEHLLFLRAVFYFLLPDNYFYRMHLCLIV